MESLSTIIGNRSVGVIGVGKWGSHLVHSLQPHTPHPILQSDFKRAAREPNFSHVPLPELTEKSDIIFLATDLTEIRGILLQIRDKLRQSHMIIDIGSSKRGFVDILREIDAEGTAVVGSIHPMSKPPPDIPSLRGQNGIICTVSDRSREAESIGEALFSELEMTIHRMQLEEHDRLMNQLQGKPHFFQVGACMAMGEGLGDDRTVEDLERLGSPNSELFMLSLGRGAILSASLQADLITSMAASDEGIHDLEQAIVSLQSILDLAKHDSTCSPEERKLPAFIEDARRKLDPSNQWRERMKGKTNTIIVRLANIRKKSLHLTAKEDRKGLLKEICVILERHGIDMNAIDSLPGKLPGGMEFEIGRKDKTDVHMQKLMGDLSTIEVLLKQAEAQN